MERKAHNQVEQHYYLDFIVEYGPMTADDLAMTFDVHRITAWRKLEGLVHQGKLRKERREIGVVYEEADH
jgi:predicted transcriptional regulator